MLNNIEPPAHIRPHESENCGYDGNAAAERKRRLRALYRQYAPLLAMPDVARGSPPVREKPGLQCGCGGGWCPAHGTDHLDDDREKLASETAFENFHRTMRLVRRKKLGKH